MKNRIGFAIITFENEQSFAKKKLDVQLFLYFSQMPPEVLLSSVDPINGRHRKKKNNRGRFFFSFFFKPKLSRYFFFRLLEDSGRLSTGRITNSGRSTHWTFGGRMTIGISIGMSIGSAAIMLGFSIIISVGRAAVLGDGCTCDRIDGRSATSGLHGLGSGVDDFILEDGRPLPVDHPSRRLPVARFSEQPVLRVQYFGRGDRVSVLLRAVWGIRREYARLHVVIGLSGRHMVDGIRSRSKDVAALAAGGFHDSFASADFIQLYMSKIIHRCHNLSRKIC